MLTSPKEKVTGKSHDFPSMTDSMTKLWLPKP